MINYFAMLLSIRRNKAHSISAELMGWMMVYVQMMVFYTLKSKGYGGEEEIRTLDTGLPYTRFPGERLQPLGHLSAYTCLYRKIFMERAAVAGGDAPFCSHKRSLVRGYGTTTYPYCGGTSRVN
jgi:hypothetical protein